MDGLRKETKAIYGYLLTLCSNNTNYFGFVLGTLIRSFSLMKKGVDKWQIAMLCRLFMIP